MHRLPAFTPKEISRILKENGFQLRRSSGSHFIFYHPETKKKVIVPYHTKSLPRGTLIAILKQAGLSGKISK